MICVCICAASIFEANPFLASRGSTCALNFCTLGNLRCFARSNGGLVTDQYRARIWPVLARHLVKTDEDDDDVDYDTVSSVSDSSSVVSSSTQDTVG